MTRAMAAMVVFGLMLPAAVWAQTASTRDGSTPNPPNLTNPMAKQLQSEQPPEVTNTHASGGQRTQPAPNLTDPMAKKLGHEQPKEVK